SKKKLLDSRRGGKKPQIKQKIQHRRRRMVPPGSELNQATSAPDVHQTRHAAPSARFGHGMAAYETNFVVYGGKLASGEVVAEFWMFNTSSEAWSLLSNGSLSGSSSHPPGLMYSSLTFVPPHWLYIFGGNLPHGAFSNAMYRINMAAKEKRWQKVVYRGGNELDARLVGHSTIYHKRSHSLIIYGGIRVDIARFSKLSDRLLKFDLHNGFWSELRPLQDASSRDSNGTNHAPLERAFHTALVAGDYMVVYGGYLHKHKEEETCYDHSVYLYHLTCHTWLPRSFLTPIHRSG
ncbi:Kelch repeat type 1, partial [Trinorchestia longiramus]